MNNTAAIELVPATGRTPGARHANLVLAVVVIGVLCISSLFINNYFQYIINSILVYSLVAVGLNVVLGFLGQLAFANAAFFGIGAYTAGLSMVYWEIPFIPALVLGSLAGAFAGLLMALPALRVKNYYLVIFTLAFSELVRWMYIHNEGITFGSGGFSIPTQMLFGQELNDRGKFFLFLAVVIFGVGTTVLLLKSRYGRSFVAIRENEVAAASAGINVAHRKILAFVWSGFITGMAGCLFVLLNQHIDPESFALPEMLLHFCMVMIGGLGSIIGPIIGAALLTSLPAFLSDFPGLEEIVFSILLVFVLFFMPKGIGGFLAARFFSLRNNLYRERNNA